MCGCPYMFSYNVTQKAATPDYNPDVTVITAAMTHRSLSLSPLVSLCSVHSLFTSPSLHLTFSLYTFIPLCSLPPLFWSQPLCLSLSRFEVYQ